MTITVGLSISVEIENGERKSIQARIRADSFEDDIKQMCQEVIEVTGQEVLAGYEAKLKGGVSIRTGARRYQFQGFSISYRRRSYRMPDGRISTPLDEVLGFEKYQRRSGKAKEQICALASSVSYRKAVQINGYINQKLVSASTVCRVVREVGQRIEAQEAQFEAEAAGRSTHHPYAAKQMVSGYPYKRRKSARPKCGWPLRIPARNISQKTGENCSTRSA
jgi:Uncharacterised protein family (UPF0236).